jgi:hypothetical protein
VESRKTRGLFEHQITRNETMCIFNCLTVVVFMDYGRRKYVCMLWCPSHISN